MSAHPDSLFTGKERDTETGLDYFGARYYGSNMGRFTSADPKLISRQRLLDPQQWNMYSYTRNNPLIYIDPDGKELTIYVVNHTGYSNQVAYEIGEKAAGRYREAGVKNVKVEVVKELPKSLGGDSHKVGVELLNGGDNRSVREGSYGTLKPDSPGEHVGGGKSVVDANYHYEPKQGVPDLINNAGSDVQHETGHEFLYNSKDNKPPMDRNNPGHSPDPKSPMAPGEQVNDVPFTPDEQKVLQQKLNKPNEVEKKP